MEETLKDLLKTAEDYERQSEQALKDIAFTKATSLKSCAMGIRLAVDLIKFKIKMDEVSK